MLHTSDNPGGGVTLRTVALALLFALAAAAGAAAQSGAGDGSGSAEASAAETRGATNAPAGGGGGPEARPVRYFGYVTPVAALLLLAGWGWLAMKLDQDADYFHLRRGLWDGALVGAGALAFFLLLAIPFFLLGVLLWVIVVGGAAGGYVLYRNQKVPPDRRWTFDPGSLKRRVEDIQQHQAQHQAHVVLHKPGGKPAHVPAARDPEHEIYQKLDELIYRALDRNAQRARIRVDAKSASCRYSVDGVDVAGPELDPQTAVRLVDYVKELADLDVSDRRKNQSAELKAESRELGIHTLHLSTSGSTRGVTLSFDIDLDRRHDFTFDQLGMLASQKQQLEPALEDKGRVVIVSGAPGEGSSTTLYRLLEKHDPYVLGVIAMERDPTLELEGVALRKVDAGLPAQEIQEKIASELRSDPDVVMFDFEPTPKTAELVAKSAEDIRFYLDFDQPSAMAALERWIKLVGDRKLAGSAVAAVLAQRLVRKLCPTCRVAFKPDPARLKKLGLPAEKVTRLHRASGKVEIKGKTERCPDCKGMGYAGRTAVFEVMPLDPQGRAYVSAGEFDHLKGHLRKQKVMYMQEAALAKVVEGVTDIKEITRVLQNGDGEGSGSSKPRSGAGGRAKPGGSRPAGTESS